MAGTEPFEIACRDITSLSFHPDGPYFVTGDRSGFLRQWSAIDRLQVSLWTMNTKEQINGVAVSNDGRRVISHSTGNKFTIWSAVTVAQEREVELTEHTGTQAICALDISNDFTRLATGSTNNIVRIFDIASGSRPIQVTSLQPGSMIACVKFSPDASRIAIATYGREWVLWVTVYNASDSKSSGSYLSRSSSKYGHPIVSQQTIRVAWSSDAQQIFVASPSTGTITCFDMSSTPPSSECLWYINPPNANVSNQQASNLSIVTSGKFIACSTGSSLSFWDCVSREQIGHTLNHAKPINCIAVSRDGRRLACGHDGGITVHNLEGFIPEHVLPGILSLPLIRVSATALKSWVQGNATETEAILSEEIAQRSNPAHDLLAVCALVRTHLGEWKTALEQTEMIKPSLIGRIARSIALVVSGEQEAALHVLDLVFWDCNPSDIKLLLVIKSVLLFVCNKRKDAISHLRYFIDACDGKMKDVYLQVLGMMYLKQGDYKNAVETLGVVENPFTTEDRGSLMTLFIIFNWNFENLKSIAWQRACERLYATGSVKEVGDTLLKMVNPLPENEKERAHGEILQEIITRSGEVTLLAWSGKSSTCNSCLPSSPAVYAQTSSISSSHTLQGEALLERIAELREIVPLPDALMTYGSVTRSQPVLFAQFRLLLPCIVFRVKALRKEREGVYCAETIGLGDVTFTTTDSLPLKQPRKLVFVNPWIDHLRESHGIMDEDESDTESNPRVGNSPDAALDVELAHEPMIEEVPIPPSRNISDADVHTRAFELIARLGQPFSAPLLLKQPDSGYKRVAADHEIIVHGIKDDALRDLCVEVLEVL